MTFDIVVVYHSFRVAASDAPIPERPTVVYALRVQVLYDKGRNRINIIYIFYVFVEALPKVGKDISTPPPRAHGTVSRYGLAGETGDKPLYIHDTTDESLYALFQSISATGQRVICNFEYSG